MEPDNHGGNAEAYNDCKVIESDAEQKTQIEGQKQIARASVGEVQTETEENIPNGEQKLRGNEQLQGTLKSEKVNGDHSNSTK